MLLNARLILISYHFSCLKHECLVIAGNLDFYYKQNSGKKKKKKKKRKKNKERKVWKISVKLMYMSTGILDEF